MITTDTDIELHSSHVSYALPVALGAGFIALIVVLGLAYDYGRARHATVTSAETTAIEDEDIAFCSRLGIAQNSDAFARCKSGLVDIRQSHQERTNSVTSGMF
jgi:hypothetical protein